MQYLGHVVLRNPTRRTFLESLLFEGAAESPIILGCGRIPNYFRVRQNPQLFWGAAGTLVYIGAAGTLFYMGDAGTLIDFG